MNFPTIQRGDKIIERKIPYDSVVVEHDCKLLEVQDKYVVLFHAIQDSFTLITSQTKLSIPKGSYTIGYYWKDKQGKYLFRFLF